MARVAVIGGGFVGLATAFWLMRDGHDVTLFERGEIGKGASFGNAGTFANYACIPVNNPSIFHNLPRLLTDARSPFRLSLSYLPKVAPWLVRFLMHSTAKRSETASEQLAILLSRAYEGYAELILQASLEKFIVRRECLYLYSSLKDGSATMRELERRRSLGVDLDLLGDVEVQKLEPALAPIFQRGVLFRGSFFLSDPHAFLVALHQWLVRQGLRVQQATVESVTLNGQAPIVTIAGAREAYDKVVVAAGAHSWDLAKQCGDAIPLDTERGYHLRFPETEDLISRPIGWAEHGFYMTPMSQGIRSAGTVELAGFTPRQNRALLSLLNSSAKEALPALPEAVDPWLGFRPTLPDGLPVIGRSSSSEHVIYAFGHQHIGLTLGGLTGAFVSDLVAGRPSHIDLAPYSPRRFRSI